MTLFCVPEGASSIPRKPHGPAPQKLSTGYTQVTLSCPQVTHRLHTGYPQASRHLSYPQVIHRLPKDLSYPQVIHRFLSYHRFTTVVNSVTIVACVVTGLQVCASVGAYRDYCRLCVNLTIKPTYDNWSAYLLCVRA